MVVFLSISLVATPPMVSMDRKRCYPERRMSPAPASPASLCSWIAPMATHSSGFRTCWLLACQLFTFSPVQRSYIDGTPTSNTLPSSRNIDARILKRVLYRDGSALYQVCGSVRQTALVRFISRCFGPSAVAVMNGRVDIGGGSCGRSFFAFSAASFSLWRAILSLDRSTPSAFLNSEIAVCNCIVKMSPQRPGTKASSGYEPDQG